MEINPNGFQIIAQQRRMGYTIVESVIAMAILGITVAAMVGGYVFSATQAERAGFSVAAHALAMQRIEQMRAAKWDTRSTPPVDELVSSNFPPQVIEMDIPRSGGVPIYGTNITTIRTLSTAPPLKELRVDCVWSFLKRKLVTNTIVTYRVPDQ